MPFKSLAGFADNYGLPKQENRTMSRRNADHCKIQLATFERGIAGVLENRLVPRAESVNIDLQIIENNDFDDFVALLAEGKVEAAVVPVADAYKVATQGVLRDLYDEHYSSFREGGFPPYTVGEGLFGLSMNKLDSVLVIPDKVDLEDLKEALEELLELIRSLFCDREKAVKPIDKNSLEWEVDGPDTISAEDAETCTLQTYTVRFRAENAKIQHIIWNKKPPEGGRSVERTAMDDEGDHPDGKESSEANLDEGTWKVPFCSPGKFVLKVTVIWICLLDNQRHMESQEKIITAR